MSMYKQFDRKLYEENDAIGKQKASEVIHKIPGLIAIENPKKKGVDLLIYRGNVHICNIEVERKVRWTEKDFGYDNINFPLRKEKYCLLDKPTIFIMFSADWSNYLTVDSKTLLVSPKEEVHNKYVRFGEFFFKVPKCLAVYNNLEESIKQLGV